MSVLDENPTTEIPPGRLIQQFLFENKDGATVSEIQQYLRSQHANTPVEDINKLVETTLDKGASLGFLERKGSHYMNWLARETGCRRRRRSRRRRRPKRCNRRRRSRRRRRCRCS